MIKREMRGTDDGIAEIDDRSISSCEREREREMDSVEDKRLEK